MCCTVPAQMQEASCIRFIANITSQHAAGGRSRSHIPFKQTQTIIIMHRFRIPARATHACVLCTRNGRREIDFTAASPPSRRAVIAFHVARSGLMRSTAAGHRRNNVYTLICSPPTCLGTSPCFMSLIKHFQHCHHHLATLM